jgi:integrase
VTTMATTRKRTKDRLTPMQVKHAVDGWLNDGAGLHLRIKGQSKKWVFRYVRSGKAVEIGLGGADRVTLKTARELRDQHLATLAKGDDPRAARIKATAGRKTFAEVAADLIEARQKKWRAAANDGRTSSLDTWSKSLLVDCKRIAGRLVSDITTDDIRPIVQRYWNEGHEQTARRSLGRIEMVFDRAIALGWRTSDNPATWRRFQHILQAQGEDGPRANHPALDWRDAPAFMSSLKAESSIAAMALEMLILTGCRSGEVRGMRWDEIDFDTAVWTIPGERMKRKFVHQVPLSAAALAILARLEATRTGALVFPGRSSAKPVDNVTVWQLVQHLTGRQEEEPITATPHGMRSTFRSWAAFHRVDFDLAEACLAHKVGSAVSQRYNREALLELRRPIMESWSAFLSGEDSADVVSIRRGAA